MTKHKILVTLLILLIGITIGGYLAISKESTAKTTAVHTANYDSSAESLLTSKTNNLRASKGLPPLTYNSGLQSKARSWAAARAVEGRMYHSNAADGNNQPWILLGENVGVVWNTQQMFDMLVASPSHYANIVNPNFTHMGVGVAIQRDGALYFAQEFMQLPTPPTTTIPSTAAPKQQQTNSCK